MKKLLKKILGIIIIAHLIVLIFCMASIYMFHSTLKNGIISGYEFNLFIVFIIVIGSVIEWCFD